MKHIVSADRRSERLHHFFHPLSIAIVGASERGMYPSGLLSNLLDYGYAGKLYPVNPRREVVFGLPCYADLAQIPQVPDLVIVVVPRRSVLSILRQCVELGVPAALVITAGFAEADPKGKELQLEMSQILAGTSLTVVGPNCAGLASTPDGVIATRLTSRPKIGSISFVSQSGALMMTIYGLFAERELGVCYLISLGNQVDVSLAEALAYMAADENTAVIGAFVEGLQNGRDFAAALALALVAGKPVVLVKSGRTEAGQVAASTHTAALAGSDRVFSAVCRQFGVIQAADIDEMIDIIQLLEIYGKRLDGEGRVGVITQSGGLGSLTADLCQNVGLQLPPLSADVQEALRKLPQSPQIGDLGNPADVRGAAVIGEAAARTLWPFIHDPDTDVIVLLLAKSALRMGEDLTAQAITNVFQAAEKPLLVVWVGQRSDAEQQGQIPATDLLVEAGIPVFESPRRAITALAHAISYWRFRARWLADPEVKALAS